MQTTAPLPPPTCAVMAGPTGLVGQTLCQHLQDDARYQAVWAYTRRPLTAPGRIQALPLTATPAPLPGPTVFFCALGTTRRKAGSAAAFRAVDVTLALDLAQRARAAGADRAVVISSVGAARSAGSFYLRCKAEMEEGMAALGFAALHVLRPSLLLGARQERRPAEQLGQWAMPVFAPLLRGGLSRYRPVTIEAVAARMGVLAQSPLRGLHIHHF